MRGRRSSCGKLGVLGRVFHRSSSVPLVTVILALALGATASTSAQQTSDWPQFRQSPTLTGVARSALPADLELLWTYDAGAPVDSSAAIVGGVVYVGSAGGELLAIDLATGTLKWKYTDIDPDFGIGESSPAVAGGTVYIGDLEGVFHAVDAATGQARWTFTTQAEIKSSPVVIDDKVLIGSYDGNLYALATATGERLWSVLTDNYVHATPAIWNGIAYFGGCDELFHGVRLSDGHQVVDMSIEAYTAASPAIADGVAYFGTFANDVVAVDIATERVLWRFMDPDRQFPFYSSPGLTDELMILGGRDKFIRALDRKTGEQRWAFPTRARVDSSPAIVGDRVVIGSGDGKVYVLDAATGQPTWEFESGAGFTASPAVANGRVIIGDVDGRIYAFGAR